MRQGYRNEKRADRQRERETEGREGKGEGGWEWGERGGIKQIVPHHVASALLSTSLTGKKVQSSGLSIHLLRPEHAFFALSSSI